MTKWRAALNDRSPFLWGAAISAHQTEGRNVNSDWWRFEQDVLRERGIETSGDAADHWHHFREDIDLLAKTGLNALRFSIEWAKVEPVMGSYDQRVLDHYDEVLAYLSKKRITACVTLWHFTLPAWASEHGGWNSRIVRKRFYAYIETCVRRFRSRVHTWSTLNEPMVYLMEGYRWGTWPPRTRSRWQALRMFLVLRSMHRHCYAVLKRHEVARVGIAKSIIVFECTHAANVFRSIKRMLKNWVWNKSFFTFAKRFHDYIGINFYITETVGPKRITHEKDDMGWEVRPHGLGAALREAWTHRKPIYVLENGIATQNDERRIAYIRSRVTDVRRALEEGIDVRGYFYWSLLDNFEWDKGYAKRFGLIAVNRTSMEREPKPSLRTFGDLARKHAGRSH